MLMKIEEKAIRSFYVMFDVNICSILLFSWFTEHCLSNRFLRPTMDPCVTQTTRGPIYRSDYLSLLHLLRQWKLPMSVVHEIAEMVVITYPDPPMHREELVRMDGWSGPFLDEDTQGQWWYHESSLGKFYYMEYNDRIAVCDE